MIREKHWVRTNEFRFVERSSFSEFSRKHDDDDVDHGTVFMQEYKQKILQQKFELRYIDDKLCFETPDECEWRDIPIAQEY